MDYVTIRVSMFLQLFFSRIVGLPVWWYGSGLAAFLRLIKNAVSGVSKSLALRVWMKNLFVPMYGDTSFAGRAISFGIRLVMVIARGLGVILFSVLSVIGFVVYVLALPAVVLGLVYSLLVFF